MRNANFPEETMAGKRGWDQQLMMSLFKKAGSYNAAVTVNDSNWCSIKGHSDFAPKHADTVVNDLNEVSGSELATDQSIDGKGFTLTIPIPRVRPNILIGMMAGALGGLTPTQDGAVIAYKHAGTPCASTASLPDFNLIGIKAGDQQLYKGIMVNSVEISGEEGKPISMSVELIGSGSRASNASSFAALISEARLYMRHLTGWRESGATISVDSALTQGLENISSGTPLNISSRMKSFKIKYSNNIVLEYGAGSALDYAVGADFGRRTVAFDMVLRYNDTTERAAYEAQTNMAVEFDVKGDSLIAEGGTFYPGFNIVLPRFRFSEDPAAEGGLNDKLLVPYKTLVMDDGVNPWFKFTGYNAVAAYLAA